MVATPAAPNVTIRKGYTLSLFASGLNYPDSITFGPKGQIWVSESAFIPGVLPRILKVNANGTWTPILTASQLPPGALVGPLTDVSYHQGWLWVTHLQQGANGLLVGAISKFRPADPVGTFRTVITNLPSFGGGYTFGVLFKGGRAYFSEGTVTNSSVVDAADIAPGNQSLLASGSAQNLAFHDYAPVNLVLNGVSYTTSNGLTGLPAVTGPFQPYGSGPVAPGTIVPAASPANPQSGIIAGSGAVYSFKPNAKDPTATLRLEAWGFRQPYGLVFNSYHPNQLYVTNNGIDLNGGVRVVNNDYDTLSRVRTGLKTPQFFGWPDYFHDPNTGAVLPVSDPVFAINGTTVKPVLDPAYSRSLKVQPALSLGYHVNADQMAFSTSKRFGYAGELFIAEGGAVVGETGATEFTGYKVVRVNPRTGQTSDFIAQRSEDPSQIFVPTNFIKPIDVKFRGGAMYIVDLGDWEGGNRDPAAEHREDLDRHPEPPGCKTEWLRSCLIG